MAYQVCPGRDGRVSDAFQLGTHLPPAHCRKADADPPFLT